ncbi:MAG: endonuclease III [Thermoleophilia bacterium]|nr:endonuclease III [Thermoleophilia bacterium]
MVAPARLLVVIRLLDQQYGRPGWVPRFQPVEELVYTILSQNTSDINAERSLASLKRIYPDWERVARAPASGIAAAVRSGGLAGAKARYIRETLSGLLAEHGSLKMDFLGRMSDSEAIEYLTKFPGVGVKTASCVLLFSLGRPVMPVDTHVYRVCKRLDFLPQDASRENAHRVLNAMVPPGETYSLHVNLIRLGRQVCVAGRPRCDRCVIERLCPSSRLCD